MTLNLFSSSDHPPGDDSASGTGTPEDQPLAMEIVEHLCDDSATPEERAKAKAWFAAEERFEGWKTPSPAEIAQRAAAVVRRAESRGTAESKTSSGRTSPRAAWYAMVPALGLAVMLVLGITTWLSPDGLFRSRSANSQASIYTTGNGERASITLPDGSRVTLHVASRLEIPADYAYGNRTVRLDGAAMFLVTHNVGTPFTVVAGPSTTRVLGTSFLVRHYATDTAATVAVRDGRVSVGSVILAASQQATVTMENAPRVTKANPEQFNFARGVLTLNGVPLRDAVPDLRRWYDADIRIGDPSLDVRRLTAEFTSGSIAELAEILEMALDIRVVRTGRILTLYPRG